MAELASSMNGLRCWTLALGIVGAVGCTSPSTQRSQLELRPCSLADGALEAMCTKFTVPEDRSLPGGRTIELEVAVVEALAARPKLDPLFILVGGPGQAATKSGAHIAQVLSRVRRQRDIVLVDQRGTGSSHPLLCPEEEQDDLGRRFERAFDTEELRRCLPLLDADTAQYATPMAMRDLDEVRAGLGYEQLNLWGGSYGTRAALSYATQYPGRVRRIVLDGAAPTDLKLPLFVGRDAQRAIDSLYAACAADPACARAFPRGAGTLQALLLDLSTKPRRVTVTHPRTGAQVSFDMHAEGFVGALRSLLYLPELTAMIPLLLARAADGDWGPFVAASVTLAEGMGEDRIPLGMFLAVVCAEDASQINAEQVDEFTRGNFFGRSWLDAVLETCKFWPHARLGPEYFAPNVDAAPTLVLSGEVDPVVPPQWGELVASRRPNARHLTIKGLAHGVSGVGCVPDLIAEFIEGTELRDLDASCIDRIGRRPFFTHLGGTEP
jgi:pimeloyl-ACP methyl ester carboxylesterase